MDTIETLANVVNTLGSVGALIFLFFYADRNFKERVAEYQAREREANARAERYLALLLRSRAIKTDIDGEGL